MINQTQLHLFSKLSGTAQQRGPLGETQRACEVECRMREAVWDLIRAACGGCSCDDDKEVEEDAKRGDPEDDRCDSGVDLPKVLGGGATKEQQRGLQYQR